MDVLKERKQKRDQRAAFLKGNRDLSADTLKTIGIGDKQLQGLQISPDGRFVTYRLYQPPTAAKNTIVPDYVQKVVLQQISPAAQKWVQRWAGLIFMCMIK
jgi:hypothetical protein